MSIYRDGQNDIGVTIGQFNADNLSVSLEGVAVQSHLYGYDSGGANWDRLVASAAGLLVDTELPPAAALTDDFATPTAPAVGAFGMMYDGATWDMMRGTSALGLQVDTEMPAAAALADDTATPTVPGVGAFGMVYDGATWDMMRGSAEAGIVVQGAAADAAAVVGNPVLVGGVDGAGNVQQFLTNTGGEIQVAELGGPVALSDGFANPTLTLLGTFLHVWNSATWDRTPGDSANGMDVDVTRLIPGTGATALGKAIDSVVGATDTGVAMLGQHGSSATHLTTDEGDYDIVRLSDFGAFNTAPEQHFILDSLNSATGWSAFNTDTINLATTLKHVVGTNALTFDKVNGAANTIFAAIDRTVTAVDLGSISPHDIIQTAIYIPDLTDVAYVFVRLGTDDTNYNEWRIPDEALTAATFEILVFNIGDANYAGITGNGWNPSAITYAAVGVAFDLETNALAGIVFDELSFHTNQHTSAELAAEVTSSVSSANVNLHKIGGSVTDKGAGNASNGSQRVVIASDDVLTLAIRNAVELIDNPVAVLGTATYTEASTSGMIIGAVRNDALAALADTDNEIAPLQVNANGALYIGGEAIDGAAVALHPVLLAGSESGTTRVLSARQWTADAAAIGFAVLEVAAHETLWNGASWDRTRNNEEATILASAVRAVTTNSTTQTNYNAKGIMLFLNVTVNPGGAETLTIAVDAEDPVSGNFVPLTVFAADAVGGAAGTRLYTLYPGALETAAVGNHEVMALPCPRNYRVTVTHSAAGNWTYSIGVSYLD